MKTGPLTLHTKTAIHFAEVMTGVKFTITPAHQYNGNSSGERKNQEQKGDKKEDQCFGLVIECVGMDYISRFAEGTMSTSSSSKPHG